jgi:hypothetical protein
VYVLRQVHRALVPRGLVLDIHPLGNDFPILAGERGVGFVDTSKFRQVLEAMNGCVDELVREGLFEELRTVRRHVVERYDTVADALEEADGWTNLRLPAPVRRRLENIDAGPIEFIDTVRYRLMRKRSPRAGVRPRSRAT